MKILRISTFSTKVVLTRRKMTSDGHLSGKRGHPSGKRRFVSFPITDFQKTKRQLLTWVTSHDLHAGIGTFCFLDNHGYPAAINPGFECLLAAGAYDSLETPTGQAFSRLKEWAQDRREWLFGHFAYDLAAETEPGAAQPGSVQPGAAQSPQKPDPVGFPDLFFFIPEFLIELGPQVIRIGSFADDQEAVLRRILATPVPAPGHPDPAADKPEMSPYRADTPSIPPFVPRFSPAEYRERVAALQRHIL